MTSHEWRAVLRAPSNIRRTDVLMDREVVIGSPGSMLEVAESVRGLERGRSVDDVVVRLTDIERQKDGYRSPARRARGRRGKAPDGVACFNFLYLSVTERVRAAVPQLEHPAFVERLTVVFAEFYLMSYDAARAQNWVSKAWAPLFEQRLRSEIAPVQFALAGMHAHINNDLSWALLQVWEEFDIEPADGSAEHRDFREIDRILAEVQTQVRATLESGFLRWLNRALGRLDDRVASFSIAKARAEAWDRAVEMRERPELTQSTGHERQVGFQSHLILAP